MSAVAVPKMLVVDISGPPTQVAGRIDSACRELGFFQIVGHGGDEAVCAEMWRTTRRFFDLPLAERMCAARPHPEHPYGYVPFSAEALAQSVGQRTAGDLKETFNAGPPEAPNHAMFDADEAELFAATPWPPALPEMSEVFGAYFREMDRLAHRLMTLFAIGLGLAPTYFDPCIDRAPGALRALNYPEQARQPAPGQLRAGPHTDYGTLTILRQDDAPGGLEVRDPHRAGQWLPAPAIDDAFVVNIGDLLARWTNDRWRSTLHRVVNPATAAGRPTRRQSIAFFHNANYDCEVRCLPSCLEPGDVARYPPVRAGAHLVGKFRSTNVQQGQKSSSKATSPLTPTW